MKTLLLNHYKLIKKRGLIHPGTNVDDFMDKIKEEYYELWNAYAEDVDSVTIPSDDFMHEATDLVMVILNMMQHYNIDFQDQLKKNIKIQEGRI